MKKNKGPIAVIDIGAHFARLEIAQMLDDGTQYETLERLNHTVPLGLDVFTKGKISASNTFLVGNILKDFAKLTKEYGANYIKAVATSAVREATNRELFIDRIKQISGIEINVLETAEEARIIFLAVKDSLKDHFNFQNSNAMICSIGTGSTQISFVQNGLLKSSEAVNIGSLRLVDELGRPVSSKQLRNAIKPFVNNTAQGVFQQASLELSDLVIAVGASVRAILNFDNVEINTESTDEVKSLSIDQFNKIYSDISEFSPAELAEKYNVSDVLAQSIEPCCGMLYYFTQASKANKLLIPMVTTREAIIKDFIREISNVGEDPFTSHLISCTKAIGSRYNYDEKHADAVRQMSLFLFDKTKALHNLGAKEKKLLEIAALLHDIGIFVNNRRHHKHSYYLIKNSQIPGMHYKEQNIVAAIARYHRRTFPKIIHPEYGSLVTEEKIIVNDLSAILRVADSLDFAHNTNLIDARINYKKNIVEIMVDKPIDEVLENWIINQKADMFKEVFGYKIQILSK